MYRKILLLMFVVCSSSVMASNKKEQVEMPVQLKPERMKLLEQIANENLVDEELPFTEESATDLKQMLTDKDDYVKEPVYDPERLFRTLNMSMQMGDQKVEKIYLSPNKTTTLVFADKLGKPWTIKKYTVSTPSKFTPDLVNENMLIFSPKVANGNGNVMIFFKEAGENAPFPITLDLEISKTKVDYITQIKLDDYGNHSPRDENMRIYVGGQAVNSKYANSQYSEFVSGTTPNGYRALHAVNDHGVRDDSFQIWTNADKTEIHVKTVHSLFYPPLKSTRRTADGKTSVFTAEYVPRIIVKKDGKIINLKLED